MLTPEEIAAIDAHIERVHAQLEAEHKRDLEDAIECLSYAEQRITEIVRYARAFGWDAIDPEELEDWQAEADFHYRRLEWLGETDKAYLAYDA